MFVALIVLIVMTLAGLALLRQMGVGTSIAGNVAFKENATSVADRGTEFARHWLIANTRSPPPTRRPTAIYSSWDGSVDPTTFDWDDASRSMLVDDDAQTGNTARIIIQRLCAVAGTERDRPSQNCSDSPVLNSGGSKGGGGYPSSFPGRRRRRSFASRRGSTARATQSATPRF